MALDEALLRGEGRPDDARPVLRLYTWSPDALSLGYFQRYDEVTAALRGAGHALPTLVRRMTGGGAIHHLRELTFSIAADAAHPLYRGPIAGSYERVHRAVAAALRRHGAEARERGADALTSDDAASPMCFHGSTAVDLVWNGRKGVGSAQRRTGGRVLHHGSIKLGSTPLEGAIATLGDIAPEELAETLLEVLGEAFGATFEDAPPREEELLYARARERFFASDAHLRRR